MLDETPIGPADLGVYVPMRTRKELLCDAAILVGLASSLECLLILSITSASVDEKNQLALSYEALAQLAKDLSNQLYLYD